MAGRQEKFQHVVVAVLVIAVLATLGISIGTLVTTVNIQNKQNNAPVVPVPVNTTPAPATKGPVVTNPVVTNPPVTTAGPVTTAQPATPAATCPPVVTAAPPPNGWGNPLNLPSGKQLPAGSSNYNSYQSVVQLLKQGLNTSVNPCDDFYAYTCGAFQGKMSFEVSDDDNFMKMAQQMMNATYVAGSPSPVKQVVQYFNSCRDARANWNTIVADGKMVTNAINALMAGEKGFEPQTQFPFPMYDQKSKITAFPNNIGMGFLLGFPMGVYGVSTLVSSFTDTNWKDPHGTQGYGLFVDQPTTMLPNTYYLKAWDSFRPAMIQNTMATMNLYAMTQSKQLDQARLEKDATAIVDLDFLLATTFSTDDTTRRQFGRSYNQMTIGQMQAQYNNIFWHVYFPELLLASTGDIMGRVLDKAGAYNFLVMEPAKLQMINDALVKGNKYGIQPEVMVNYIYYNLVSANSDYLPWPPQNNEARVMIQKAQALRKTGRKGVIPEKKKFERRQMSAVHPDDIAISCAGETMQVLQYANARVFIDKIYPTQASRDAIHQNMAKVASSIVIGMRSMIDQLSWMTDSTKKGAYYKIENLVKNIAYPDWITDDNQLTQYHVPLGFADSDQYLDLVNKVNAFALYQLWNPLAAAGTNRIDFNGPPGTTNAWYQPELNSITFPAAILRQPFYDPQWPAAVNFGSMGVIAGHELTHGFDDQGVQWDGTGVLNGWMDSQSNDAFTNMASCVVNEYNGFCPLNKTVYADGACVDGAQTQGENIADNGGIHSAFRAYKNYVNLYGPDQQLPDDILQYFTADQLFFLGFAQVWCQIPPKDSSMETQILVDVHSPSKYRVFGTIQNFPAFKDAFHCPTPSAYAPDDHCNVWVSDISTSYGLPAPQTDLNIPSNPQQSTSDSATYSAYQQAVGFYQPSVNLKADPCNDFWSYACGSYNDLVSFHHADAANLVSMAQQLTDPKYQPTVQSSTALTKEKTFFDACVATTGDATVNNNTLASKNYLFDKVTDLQTSIGYPFSIIFSPTTPLKTLPNKVQLANALGYLSFKQGIDTLVTPMVDTNWIDNSIGYRLFLDQNTAEMSKTYYAPEAFKTVRAGYIQSTVAVLTQFALEQGQKVSATLQDDVTRLIDFEQLIAYNYSTDDTTRRQYMRSWNLMTVDQMTATYPIIDWASYFANVPQVALPTVGNAAYQVSVMETNMLTKLSTDYAGFAPTTVINYLYMRLVLDNAQYLPQYGQALSGMPKMEESFSLGRSRLPRLPRRRLAAVSQTQTSCVSMANELMQFANGRVFVDYLYPTDALKQNIRTTAGGLIKNVINSFQGMLEQLDWMDAPTQRAALDKTNGILQNIAFPDWITNNTALDAYYKNLVFAQTDNYYDMWDKLIKFNIMLQYQQLTFTSTDRHDFLGQPGTVNAWYQPELNSITFPAGILRPPYFHPLWPASVNYGGMGVVAGHELTHGFDDEGVQWGPTGNLAGWMDMNSTSGFNTMAQCVIKEYSNFCPLDPKQYTPNCVNGQQTQGENIADNGGIHAAFRAYRTHVNLNGPDPQLPDRIFGQFTHDQLFFLNFGQVWCEKARSLDNQYKQLMVDPHSPSQYRVFGTIQNFPAFRTAYNCPLNTAYGPADHCKVWVPNVEA